MQSTRGCVHSKEGALRKPSGNSRCRELFSTLSVRIKSARDKNPFRRGAETSMHACIFHGQSKTYTACRRECEMARALPGTLRVTLFSECAAVWKFLFFWQNSGGTILVLQGRLIQPPLQPFGSGFAGMENMRVGQRWSTSGRRSETCRYNVGSASPRNLSLKPEPR